MRTLTVIAAALGMSLSLAHAQQEFPFTAYVTSSAVYARSGPGEEYYPTEKIEPGQAVEVYRHDPPGWCAIRPLADSTSWVTADEIEMRGEGIGVVKRDGTASRIGTRFRSSPSVIQVRLKRGETVEVLSAKTIRGRRCLEIAPPSGEFRYIERNALSRRSPVAARESRQPRDDIPNAEPIEEESVRDETGSAMRQNPDRHVRTVRALESKAEATSEQGFTWADRGADTTALRSALPRPTSVELADIDLELSAIAAEDVESWSLSAVRARAQRALDDAQSALDRGRVRAVISKIERFEEIKRRYDEQQQPAASRSATSSATFDGIGRLAPVSSQKAGAPPYALLSASGEIMSYVTPAPGVNLRPYLSQMVGVSGRSNYVPEARRQHISAERVLPLEQAQLPVVRR